MTYPRPSPRSVTVFGGTTVDIIARTKAAPVMGASNPGSVRRLVGGVGFNVAMILSRLGLPTVMATAIGSDPEGEAVVMAARNAGMDADGFHRSKTSPTGTYLVTLDDAGGLILGVADMRITDEITPDLVMPFLGDKSVPAMRVADANLPPATLALIARRSAEQGVPLAALTVSPAKAMKFAPLLDQVTFLFTNRREASALLGRPPETPAPAAELAAALAANRATTVIVTDGAEPLAVAANGTVATFAPPPVAVRAVNGAGDSFAAGTIAALASGKPIAAAVGDGMAAAALTLTYGNVPAAPFAPGALGTPETTAP